MGIRVEPNATYTTQNGSKVRILQSVSSDFVGHWKKLPNYDRIFVPTPFFRARFMDTGEVVFFNQWGNIISEEPGSNDKAYALSRRIE